MSESLALELLQCPFCDSDHVFAFDLGDDGAWIPRDLTVAELERVRSICDGYLKQEVA